MHQAAHLLHNPEKRSPQEVQDAYESLLTEMRPFCAQEGLLGQAATQFVKVTQSYGKGLFACYHHPDLPRTNNDLESLFGSCRYWDRRANGRKTASPTLVVRGSVRLVVGIATRQKVPTAAQLQPRSLPEWRRLRRDLEKRHETRRIQLRFRRNPQQFLQQAEDKLFRTTLPT